MSLLHNVESLRIIMNILSSRSLYEIGDRKPQQLVTRRRRRRTDAARLRKRQVDPRTWTASMEKMSNRGRGKAGILAGILL
jgi:hypothetical protein